MAACRKSAKAMTGTSWNGHRFFGLRTAGFDLNLTPIAGWEIPATPLRPAPPQRRSKTAEPRSPDDLAGRRRRHEIGERQSGAALRHLYPRLDGGGPGAGVQLARRSTGGLGSLRQKPAHEGWKLIRTTTTTAASLAARWTGRVTETLDDIRARRIDVIVVYKVDRLTRSLADFAKLVELFDAHQVSFVSVTQAFNTTTSMGRLTLNVLLSFAQFEREVTGERIRDKIAASKRKGIWMGGVVPLGYRVENRALHVVEEHAVFVRDLYRRYLEIGSVVRLKAILDQEDARLPLRTDGTGKTIGGRLISGAISTRSYRTRSTLGS